MRTYGTVKRATTGDGWVIECEPHVMMRLKRAFGRVSKGSKGFILLNDTPENALDLVWFTQRFPMKIADAGHLKAQAAKHAALGDQIEKILAGGYTPRPFSLALPPREYQKVSAELALRTGRLLIADDVGLGKTAQAICMISDPAARPALVVTLTHLPPQWADELKKFLPGVSVVVPKRAQPSDIRPWPDVLILNYHKLVGWAPALAGRIKSVTFDEAQELRRAGTPTHPSQKYDAAEMVARPAAFRLGLTATPIYNYGGEMYSILNVLAPGALGTWGEFAREWSGENSDRQKAQISNPKAFGTYLREQGLMIRRTRQDVSRELPGLTNAPHTIEADLGEIDKVATSATELARIILQQGGTARGEKLRASEELSWRLRQATGIAKATFVAEFVRMLVESGEQVVLYGWHKEVYAIWRERLKDLNPVMFTGDESITQKVAAKDAFVDRKAKVLIMSLRAGAGLDGLQKVSRTVVFGELDWSPGVHEQCTGRVYRDGQTDPVVAYYLIADAGSDPVVVDVLGVKRAQSEGVRDPKSGLIAASQSDPDRIKKLAEEFLRQRGDRTARAA